MPHCHDRVDLPCTTAEHRTPAPWPWRGLMPTSLTVLLLISAVALPGCQASNPFSPGLTPSSAEATGAKYSPELPPNTDGPRASVIVSDFETAGDASRSGVYEFVDARGQAHSISWGLETQTSTGRALAKQLESALASTDHFIVNVRDETFGSQRAELDLADEGWTSENQVALGGLSSPDLFVTGTITEWSPNVEGGGGGIGSFLRKVPLIGGLGWDSSVSRVGLQLQVVDRRQQIIATIPVEVEAKSTRWKTGGIGWISGSLVGGALSQYTNTTMEEALATAIKTSVERIYEDIPRSYFVHRVARR